VSEIWDCFFFNDELDLLETRLQELGDAVDRFVLVEGDRTYRGVPKPLHFEQNRDRFAPWVDKISHVIARLEPEGSYAWNRENQQRAILGSYLDAEAGPDDLILLGDVDEIPDRDAFEYLRRRTGPPIRLLMSHAVYFANWLMPRPWADGTLAFHRGQFTEPMVRLQLGDNHREWDGYREHQLADAGVHLSFLGGAEGVRDKLEAYSHQEFNTDRFRGEPHLERCIAYGVHFQGREALRKLPRAMLPPVLRRLSERDLSAAFFDFSPPAASRFRTRAYCGYTWLRTRTRLVPDRVLRSIDRHPGVVGAGAPVLWGLDAVLRWRRRKRNGWTLAAEYAPANLPQPAIERWR
jgi:beta-1,4-mannosyl-glycoprotein beta-1,4-N-acetylglucosaminyltransferase